MKTTDDLERSELQITCLKDLAKFLKKHEVSIHYCEGYGLSIEFENEKIGFIDFKNIIDKDSIDELLRK